MFKNTQRGVYQHLGATPKLTLTPKCWFTPGGNTFFIDFILKRLIEQKKKEKDVI